MRKKATRKKVESERSPFETAIISFTDRVESARLASEVYLSFAKKAETAELSRSLAELKHYTDRYHKRPDGALPILRLVRRLRRQFSIGQVDLISRSLFVTSFTFFDAFMGDLIEAIFSIRPERARAVERMLTFRDLEGADSTEEVRDIYVKKEIETLLREGYPEQLKAIEKSFGISDTRKGPLWSAFVECAQRRHTVVHANGISTRGYFRNCQREGVKFPADFRVGQPLHLNSNYLSEAFDTMHLFGLRLGQLIWRTIEPRNSKTENQFSEHIYGLMQNEQWSLAQRVGELAVAFEEGPVSETRRRLLINYAVAIAGNGDAKRAQKVVEDHDWSATHTGFKLAVAIICHHYPEARKLMLEIGRGKDAPVSQLAYHEWPLFRQFRRSPEFLGAYRKIFGTDYGDDARRNMLSLKRTIIREGGRIRSEILHTRKHSRSQNARGGMRPQKVNERGD